MEYVESFFHRDAFVLQVEGALTQRLHLLEM